MKYIKSGSFALMIIALSMALAGANFASATTITSPAGTQYSGTIKFELKEKT
jgi:hypothetical protein